MTTMATLMKRVHVDDLGCWLWTASLSNKGYSQVGDRGKVKSAHRVAYELVKGAIPVGLQIDHLCSVRRCINPDHLEAVTQSVNIARSIGNKCPNGHPYTPENTAHRKDNGRRICKECRLATSRRRGKGYGKPGRPSAAARLAFAELDRQAADAVFAGMNLQFQPVRSKRGVA